MRVQYGLVLLSALAIFQGCSSAQLPELKPVYAHPADNVQPSSKYVRFADSLGAVSSGKLESILAAFEYCGREQRLAFVTPPMPYSSGMNYSRVSTYSLRFREEDESLAATAFIAPFECIEQKHTVKTGLAESEDIGSSGATRRLMHDLRGGIAVDKTAPASAFAEGDIVTRVGTFRVESRAELAKAIDVSPVGLLAIQVVRKGKLVTIAQTSTDTTAQTLANARQLLGAVCKETSSNSPACAAKSLARN